MTVPLTTAEVIRRARLMLTFVDIGRQLAAVERHEMRAFGAYSVAIYGRSVTFMIQNLRTVHGHAEVDEWYLPKQEAMRADPMLAWFNRIRTDILKEGIPEVVNASHFNLILDPEDSTKFTAVEPTWSGVTFGGPLPKEHLGQPITDPSLATLSALYLAYLTGLVDEAECVWSDEPLDSSEGG